MMKKIITPIGGGKTTRIFRMLKDNPDLVCVVANRGEKVALENVFYKGKPQPYGETQFATIKEYNFHQTHYSKKRIVIDNVENVLNELFNNSVDVITLTNKTNKLQGAQKNFTIPVKWVSPKNFDKIYKII